MTSLAEETNSHPVTVTALQMKPQESSIASHQVTADSVTITHTFDGDVKVNSGFEAHKKTFRDDCWQCRWTGGGGLIGASAFVASCIPKQNPFGKIFLASCSSLLLALGTARIFDFTPWNKDNLYPILPRPHI